MSDDNETSFEMNAAGELVDLALDLVQDFEEEDKDAVIMEILTEAVSGILLAQKIMNPNFSDTVLLAECFDKIRDKFRSKNVNQVLSKPEEIN